LPDSICSPDAVFEPFPEAGGLKAGVSRACVLPYGGAVSIHPVQSRHLSKSSQKILRRFSPRWKLIDLLSLEAGIGNRT
jgi:hypothetical protein